MQKARPELPKSIIEGELKKEELFQNMVLRPILKMQHEILILRSKSILYQKNNFPFHGST